MKKNNPSRYWIILVVIVAVLLFAFLVADNKSRQLKKAQSQTESPKDPIPSASPLPHQPTINSPSFETSEKKVVTDKNNEPSDRNTKGDSKGPNIVLVVVDTERTDVTQPYGESRPTTPFLSQLAKEGIVFKNAFSTAPWTTPAMFSMITGLYPKEHGIVDGVVHGFGKRKKAFGQQALPEQSVTLAEHLKENGYTTFGVCTNFHMNHKFGFDQGFDHYAGGDFAYIPFPDMAIESLLPAIKKAKKWFLWLHYFDPHFPYRIEQPWFDEWNNSKYKSYEHFAYETVFENYRIKNGLEPDEPVPTKDLYRLYKTAVSFIANPTLQFFSLPSYKDYVTDDHLDFYRAAYMSTIRRTDESIKEAFSKLGIDDQTLVIATADHGEELLDHGGIGHKRYVHVYQELIHIPLIIRLPGRQGAGTVVDTPVSLVDIVPTLLDLLGKPVPADVSGVSLVPLIKGEEISNRPLFAEMKNNEGQSRSIIEYPWKYIYNYVTNQQELYNLEKDPKEKVDLTDKELKQSAAMRNRLFHWVENTKMHWDQVITTQLKPQDVNRLKELGYIH